MGYLVAVSLLWAFSFGLTKGRLAGLDSAFISVVRLTLALLVFLPFFRWRGLHPRIAFALTAIGAVQFGVMYLALNESYRYLQAYEVVLFTITTPILVTLFADLLDRTWRARALAAALLAVAGTSLVVLQSAKLQAALAGVVLMQLSNAAFAIGQVFYQRMRQRHPALRDREVFALLYLGATVVALGAMLVRVNLPALILTATQIWTLIYLGVLASGLGFFLWNVGATRVRSGTLAVMNNAKVPLGVACSLLIFGERATNPWLLVGSLLVLGFAVWLAREKPAPRRDP